MQWWSDMLEKSSYFMPHGHCYLWIPSLLWLHVLSDLLIGIAYLGISLVLYLLVRRIRLPFSPVFIAFGLFIGLCGVTHFLQVWTVWNPDYWIDGLVKAATAAASVATAIGLVYVRPQVEEVVHTARLSEERRIRLESTHAELESLYRKVKEMDELKTQFFANVSHELRTPLALMLGPAERMLNDDNLNAEQRRQLQSISRNGKTLLKQVNDLLDVARLEADKLDPDYARVDLSTTARRVASQFELAAEQRGMRFEVAAPPELVAEVDPDMVERVVLNLLSNAFKFTPDGGSIRLVLEGDDADLRLSVADSGPGVRPEQREAIFERFRQGEGSATRKHGGTGLGLAIVKDFVALHGGGTEVSNASLGGALFVVHFPRRAPAGSSVRETAPAPSSETLAALEGVVQELATLGSSGEASHPQLPGRPSALVVEDNPDMREFVASVLAETCNVVTAVDGQEGLERAQALQPDLIVTDVMMPRLAGDQLITSVRAVPALARVPILLLTARADDELRVRLLQQGAQDYLTKPFLPEELRARAINLIALKRAGDTLRREVGSLSDDVESLAHELALRHHQLRATSDAAEVAREQAERASEVKSQFLAMVSHELRTPLSTINLNLQLLSHDKANALPPALRPRVERVSLAARQMATLVEGLLEYTRVQTGQLKPRLESVDPHGLARDVADAHRDNVPPGVLLELETTAERLPPLISDPRLLRVVLDNLVSNALKFTKQGTVTIGVNCTGQHVVLVVHDTGLGIPEADIPRMFLPFEQLEPVQRKSIPGVGLGLALVKQIVDALGGELEVCSVVGQGSTFTVRLPGESSELSAA